MWNLFEGLLFGGSRKPRPHESLVLGWFVEGLGHRAGHLLLSQLEVRPLVQRFSNGKMVVFHFGTFSADLLFPNQAEELNVGRAHVAVQGQRRGIACDLVAHRGRISSLEFSAPPMPLLRGDATCQRIEWFGDLLGETARQFPVVALGPMLRRICSEFEVSGVEAQANDEEREAHLRRLSSPAPTDYSDMLRETNGFSIGEWRFLGNRARRIVTLERNYQVLAESRSLAVCVGEGEQTPRVVLYDQVQDEVVDEADSFVSCLLNGVRRGLTGQRGSALEGVLGAP
jgi:hypothetical protein